MIAENYLQVLERIAQAVQRAGRPSDSVRLVVVTKGHPASALQEAIAAGAQRLGENYAEEGAAKKQALPAAASLEWHMIGHVQSRKAALVCENFDWVQSLDSEKLANRLDGCAAQQGKVLPVLLECNVSGEETKHGWPAWQPESWPALLPEITRLTALPHLKVHGLMTMAPFLPDPEQARPYFRRLRLLQEFFAGHIPGADWGELSMGMSGDFEAAIQEGATLVRIGTAIMGPRRTA